MFRIRNNVERRWYACRSLVAIRGPRFSLLSSVTPRYLTEGGCQGMESDGELLKHPYGRVWSKVRADLRLLRSYRRKQLCSFLRRNRMSSIAVSHAVALNTKTRVITRTRSRYDVQCVSCKCMADTCSPHEENRDDLLIAFHVRFVDDQ